MAAAENLKKKISLLMATRDDAIDRGDVLDSELTDMKAQLLKVSFKLCNVTKKEIYRHSYNPIQVLILRENRDSSPVCLA